MRTDVRVGDHIRVMDKFTVQPYEDYIFSGLSEKVMVVESISISKLTVTARDVKTETLEELDCIDIL